MSHTHPAAPLGVHHLALRTRDVVGVRYFLEHVLRLRPWRLNDDGAGGLRSVWYRVGTTVLMLEPAGPDEPAVPAATHELIAFEVPAASLDAWRSHLRAEGVPVEAATAWTLYFRDPDGRRFAVSAYPFET